MSDTTSKVELSTNSAHLAVRGVLLVVDHTVDAGGRREVRCELHLHGQKSEMTLEFPDEAEWKRFIGQAQSATA